MIYRIFAIVIFFFSHTYLNAQEILTDLNDNPAISGKNITAKTKNGNIDTIQLPFIDDFSNRSHIPNQSLWVDQYTFINNSYGIGMVSAGVATFDALNQYGKHYSNASETPFVADMLTSKPINLEGVDKNSLYLSFYYQPQGYGNAPEWNDSLILQFKDTADNWITQWKAFGCTYDSFRTDTLKISPGYLFDTVEFKQTILPVNDSAFIYNAFCFRFVNHASLTPGSRPSEATNCDHWNIDYVHLDTGRNENDLIHNDIAFVKESRMFLKKYTSVPWKHYSDFTKNDDNITYPRMYVRNNSNEAYDVSPARIHYIDQYSNWRDSITIGSKEIPPFQNIEDLERQLTEIPIKYNGADSAHFTILSTLKTGDQDLISSNDTIEKTLICNNYYAYDDGTAEKRYGIDANGGYVAYRFTTAKADTLRGAKIFFPRNNPEDAASTTFALCVWDNDPNKNQPGHLRIIESGSHMRTEYGESVNEFVTIELDTAILVSGTFYIGWKQLSDSYLHIGFDANNNNKSEIFYSIYGEWTNTQFRGSLMIRPILSDKTIKKAEKKIAKKELGVYPNPSSGNINITLENEETNAFVSIVNLSGQIVKQLEWNGETIDLNDLNEGIYILKVRTNSQLYKNQRLIIQN